MLIALGLAVRFFHYALFGGTLLSPHYYVVDTAIAGSAWLSSASACTRARQMARQYGFLQPSVPARHGSRSTSDVGYPARIRLYFSRVSLLNRADDCRWPAVTPDRPDRRMRMTKRIAFGLSAGRGPRAGGHGLRADQDSASAARSPAAAPRSARSSRTAPSRRSPTSTRPAASSARRSRSRSATTAPIRRKASRSPTSSPPTA